MGTVDFPPPTSDGRRASPRVRIDGELVAHHASVLGPLSVLDANLTGFSFRAPEAFETDADLIFRLSTPGGQETMVVARVIHCQAITAGEGSGCFHVGCEFLSPTRHTLSLMADVVNRVWATTPVAAAAFSDQLLADGAGHRVVSRRRVPRFDVTGALSVTIDDGAVSAVLRDVGLGGFATESAQQFPPKTRHQVVFTGPGGFRVSLLADAMHARPIDNPPRTGWWLIGFRFVTESPQARESIARLIDRATACLQFV